jgi:hypothetical protein
LKRRPALPINKIKHIGAEAKLKIIPYLPYVLFILLRFISLLGGSLIVILGIE